MKTNQQYWADRSEADLVASEQTTNRSIPKILDIYTQAQKNIQKQIDSIFENYTNQIGSSTVLDVQALKTKMGKTDIQDFLNSIKASAKKLGLDPSKVYDERYLFRLNRLQALQEQIKFEVLATAPQADGVLTKNYTKVLQDSYNTFTNHLENTGISPSFTTLNKGIADNILKSSWENGNYSTRIWGNAGDFANSLQKVIGGGFVSGVVPETIARQLKTEFGVSTSNATRLLRTESNYFHNQANIQGYADNGLEYYDILTDSNPCPLCQAKADAGPYKVSESSVGENCCPFHPNDKCTTAPHIEDDRKVPEDQVQRFDNTVDVQEVKQKTIDSVIG